jgi:hypothetical protein
MPEEIWRSISTGRAGGEGSEVITELATVIEFYVTLLIIVMLARYSPSFL